jgi:hypothetical protein
VIIASYSFYRAVFVEETTVADRCEHSVAPGLRTGLDLRCTSFTVAAMLRVRRAGVH